MSLLFVLSKQRDKEIGLHIKLSSLILADVMHLILLIILKVVFCFFLLVCIFFSLHVQVFIQQLHTIHVASSSGCSAMFFSLPQASLGSPAL